MRSTLFILTYNLIDINLLKKKNNKKHYLILPYSHRVFTSADTFKIMFHLRIHAIFVNYHFETMMKPKGSH